MSTHPSSPFDPERRVRNTLKKVFGFDSFKTPLQERAIMAVVKGNVARLPVFTFVLLQSTFLLTFPTSLPSSRIWFWRYRCVTLNVVFSAEPPNCSGSDSSQSELRLSLKTLYIFPFSFVCCIQQCVCVVGGGVVGRNSLKAVIFQVISLLKIEWLGSQIGKE